MNKRGCDYKEAEDIVNTLRNKFQALHNVASKFTLGVTRLYLDNEITDNNAGKVNYILQIISQDNKINFFDKNINGLHLDALIHDLKDEIENLESQNSIDRSDLDSSRNENYQIVKISSFDEANKYSVFTDWCITHYESYYNDYTNHGENTFYFALRNGYQSESRKPGANTPLDDYGLSMLAILVSPHRSMLRCTCRWNHANGGTDNILTTKELCDLLGGGAINEMFSYDKREGELEDMCKRLGYNLVGPLSEKHDVFLIYQKTGFKFNVITIDKKIKYKTWFDLYSKFKQGSTTIITWPTQDGALLYGGVSLLKPDGELAFGGCRFRNVEPFTDLFAARIWKKTMIINQSDCEVLFTFDGELDEYYEDIKRIKVKLNDKYRLIKYNGARVTNFWADSIVWDDRVDLFKVRLDYLVCAMNEYGKVISGQWYTDMKFNILGFASVKNDKGKGNILDLYDGTLYSDWTYDTCRPFFNGLAAVSLNNKWNYINKENQLLCTQWFDWCDDFKGGVGHVSLDGEEFDIGMDGKPINR